MEEKTLNICMMDIKKLFTKHPATVDESYFEHLWFASRISFKLIRAAAACFIHAFLPFTFVTYASDMVDHLTFWIRERK